MLYLRFANRIVSHSWLKCWNFSNFLWSLSLFKNCVLLEHETIVSWKTSVIPDFWSSLCGGNYLTHECGRIVRFLVLSAWVLKLTSCFNLDFDILICITNEWDLLFICIKYSLVVQNPVWGLISLRLTKSFGSMISNFWIKIGDG